MEKANRNKDFNRTSAPAEPDARLTERANSTQQRAKLIDLRFGVDLVVTRFYVVLMVGKDQRDQHRSHTVKGWTKFGNTLAAILLLLGTNLAISGFIILSFYLLKSMLGISLMPGHFPDYLKPLLQ